MEWLAQYPSVIYVILVHVSKKMTSLKVASKSGDNSDTNTTAGRIMGAWSSKSYTTSWLLPRNNRWVCAYFGHEEDTGDCCWTSHTSQSPCCHDCWFGSCQIVHSRERIWAPRGWLVFGVLCIYFVSTQKHCCTVILFPVFLSSDFLAFLLVISLITRKIFKWQKKKKKTTQCDKRNKKKRRWMIAQPFN